MLRLAEVNDVGLKIPVFHTGYPHTEFSFLTA